MSGADPLGRLEHRGELLFVGIERRRRRPENSHGDKRQHDQTSRAGFDVEPGAQPGQQTRALASNGFEGQRLHKARR